MPNIPNRHGHKGIFFRPHRSKPWLALIYHKGERVYLGFFSTKEEACAEFQKYHLEYRGKPYIPPGVPNAVPDQS